MNARPGDSNTVGRTERQPVGTETDDLGATAEQSENRWYACLNCGRQFDSFTQECPDCGGQEFHTGTPASEAETGAPEQRTDILRRIAAQFNPYIPR